MELLFESRLELGDVREGKLYWIQGKAHMYPEVVIARDTVVDAGGSAVTTVLYDQGMYRMWYWGYAEDWAMTACYAESDDGITWRKPRVNPIDDSNAVNTLGANLPAPFVFIDPDSPTSHRYRGVAWYWAPASGYYTMHSPDGLHWEMDSPEPRWTGYDEIRAVYHPGRRCGLVTLKRSPYYRGIQRRAIRMAELRDGEWSDDWTALVPDDFDDVSAHTHGRISGDYYGLSLLPAGGQSMVGILHRFQHDWPLATDGKRVGVFGATDLTLAYQEEERAA